MDLHDYQLRKQLAENPFKQSGFTPELMAAIERKAGEQTRKKRTWLMYGFALCASFVVMLFFLQPGLWFGQTDQMSKRTASELQPAQPAYSEKGMSTALLLAMRQDRDQEASSYRTLLISGDEQGRVVAEQGQGLLVPVKQKFWRLHPASELMSGESGGAQSHLLTAYPADAVPQTTVMKPSIAKESPVVQEKVLFVGNQYVSIAETVLPAQGEAMRRVKVQDIEALQRTQWDWEAIRQEKVLSLEELLQPVTTRLNAPPAAKPDAGGKEQPDMPISEAERSETWNWTITRQGGKWHALAVQSADPDTRSMQPGNRSDKADILLQPLSVSLPYEVVSYDELCCAWSEILTVQPAALDAISSPAKDVVVIFTSDKMTVYPYQDGIVNQPYLTLPIQANEQMVMVHWAMGSYVQRWQEEAGRWLQMP
ncbi:hypothetical protein [Marinicrinis sediminis]|uniref:DUF3379 family protein n=1 Tax=Marinicrinis sediminis TaxID=1652465 RepID=A0ABW5RBY1_9BACL